MDAQRIGTLLIIFSALSFATFPIFIKFTFTYGISVTTMLAFRFLGAAIIMWSVIWLQGIPARVSRRSLIHLILMGAVGYGTMSSLYSSSLHYISASMTAMLLYLYPVIVSILSYLLGDETFDHRRLVALMISLCGLFLVLGTTFENLSSYGVLLASGAAFVYSGYIVCGNRLLKEISPFVTTAYITLSASIAFFAIGLFTGSMQVNLPPTGWLLLFLIALIPTVFAILTFFAGMARIGPGKASIISTLEPVGTVVLSAWLLGERFTLNQLAGGLLVLGGVILLQLWKAPATDTEG